VQVSGPLIEKTRFPNFRHAGSKTEASFTGRLQTLPGQDGGAARCDHIGHRPIVWWIVGVYIVHEEKLR